MRTIVKVDPAWIVNLLTKGTDLPACHVDEGLPRLAKLVDIRFDEKRMYLILEFETKADVNNVTKIAFETYKNPHPAEEPAPKRTRKRKESC